MKSTRLKSLTLFLLVMLSATLAGAAHGGGHFGDERPGRREIQVYFQASVLPVLQQQRQKLEPQLAETDRAQLAAYRTQLRALQAQGAALRHGASSSGEQPTVRPTFSEAQRQQAYELRAKAHEILQLVAEMAQKYDGPLQELAQQLQPQRERWDADIKAIVAKSRTLEQQQKTAASGERMHGPGALHGPEAMRGPGGMHDLGAMHHYFQPVSFLLMDPTAAPDGATERSLGNTAFYPNPVATTSQLEFEVKKAGPVSIDLLDKDGNTLRTLFAAPQAEPGAHTQQLNLQDLPAGTYFYKITTKSGSETKRFVKE